MPLVSVILPVYNQAAFLPLSLASVLNQTHRRIEVLLLDDGSRDDIASVAASFRDKRLRYRRLPHRGLVPTLNKGLKLARGAYITWTSADNHMEPDMLAELVAALERRPAYGAAYADYIQIDAAGRAIRKVSKGPPDGKKNFGPAFLYRAATSARVGPFDKTLELVEDRDYSIRMAKAAPVYWLPKTLYRYRIHKNSLTGRLASRKWRRKFLRARLALYRKHPELRQSERPLKPL